MRTFSRLALVMVLLAATAGMASAAFTGPYVDTWVTVGGTNNPSGVTLYVQDSLSTCNDSQIAYLQFDASNIATVSSASLVLTAASTQIGLDTTPKLSIYGVADFDPATLTGTNAPLTTGLTAIQTVPVPPSTVAGSPFAFGGSDTALATYIGTQAGGVVTLALSFSADCNGTLSQMNFYSQRYSNTAYRPQLTIEGTKPTAVDVSSTSAERTSLPLYAGLGAVALILVAGLAISRRRTA